MSAVDRGGRPARWSVVALVLAALPIVAAWLPLTTETTTDSSGTTTTSNPSLIASEGTSVLIVLVVPAIIALVPVLLRHRPAAQPARIAAAVLMGIGVFLALMSVGIFYVPALVALIVAAATGGRRVVRAPAA
jgi:hypothetical protein